MIVFISTVSAAAMLELASAIPGHIIIFKVIGVMPPNVTPASSAVQQVTLITPARALILKDDS